MMRTLTASCLKCPLSLRQFGISATQVCLQWGSSGSQGQGDRGGYQGRDSGGDRGYQSREGGGYQRHGRDGGDRGYQSRDGGDRGYQGRDGGDRGYQGRDGGDRGYQGRDGGDRGYQRRDGDRGYQGRDGGDRGYQGRGGGDRGYQGRGGGDRGYQGRGGGDRGYQDRGGGDRGYEGRDGGDRGYQRRDGGDRGYQGRDSGDRGYEGRDGGDRGYQGRGGGDSRREFDSGNRRGGDDHRQSDGDGYGRRSGPSASSNRGIRNAQDRVAESFGASSADQSEPIVRLSAATGAEQLLKLKLKFRSARLKKEKSTITKEAIECMKRISVDMSSQDEKSIAILLNCAVFFGAPPRGFLVKDCIQWSMANLGALSAQNVAKFAHAVGTLPLRQGHEMLLKISEAVPVDGLDAFAPVELIMLQQAFTRGNVLSNASVQVSILRKLLGSVGKMKSSELSTLMDLISTTKSPVLAKEETLVREVAEGCIGQLTPEVINAIHSNNILHFLRAFVELHPIVPLSKELWGLLLKRAIEVSKFFMDSQVGTALLFIASVGPASLIPVAESDVQALDEVVVQRAEHIALTFDMESVTSLADGFSQVKRDLPSGIADVLPTRLVQEMAWQRPKLSDVASAARALLRANVTSPEFFIAAVNFAVGKRPLRLKQAAGGGVLTPLEEQHGAASPPHEFELDHERCVETAARHFATVLKLRLAAEEALGGYQGNEHLSKTIPKMLVDAVPLCHPLQILEGCSVMLLQPRFAGRNVALDDELLKMVLMRVEEGNMLQDEAFGEGVEAFLERMLSSDSALDPVVVAVRKSRQH